VTAPQSANPNRRALIILAIGLAAALLFFLVFAAIAFGLVPVGGVEPIAFN